MKYIDFYAALVERKIFVDLGEVELELVTMMENKMDFDEFAVCFFTRQHIEELGGYFFDCREKLIDENSSTLLSSMNINGEIVRFKIIEYKGHRHIVVSLSDVVLVIVPLKDEAALQGWIPVCVDPVQISFRSK